MIQQLASIHATIEDLKRQLASCEDALWEIAGTANRGRPSAAETRAKKKGKMSELCLIVSQEFGCESADIRGRCQSKFATRARNAFCLLAYEYTGHSYPTIGVFLGRHHVTVMSSCSRAKWLRITDVAYNVKICACEEKFTQKVMDSGSEAPAR